MEPIKTDSSSVLLIDSAGLQKTLSKHISGGVISILYFTNFKSKKD